MGRPKSTKKLRSEFHEERGRAIQAYALVEQSLAFIFCNLSGMDLESSSIVFFSIIQARQRNKMIEELSKRKNGKDPFLSSALKIVAGLDEQRNRIVHWIVSNKVDLTKDKLSVYLSPPSFWARADKTKIISKGDLSDFKNLCYFVSENLLEYHGHLDSNGLAGLLAASPDKFQRALVYPPAYKHQKSPTSQE